MIFMQTGSDILLVSLAKAGVSINADKSEPDEMAAASSAWLQESGAVGSVAFTTLNQTGAVHLASAARNDSTHTCMET